MDKETTYQAVISQFMFDNPMVEVLSYDGETKFRYNPDTRRIEWRKESNKIQNKWYHARGLDHFAKRVGIIIYY